MAKTRGGFHFNTGRQPIPRSQATNLETPKLVHQNEASSSKGLRDKRRLDRNLSKMGSDLGKKMKKTRNTSKGNTRVAADIVLRGYGGWNSRRALQVLEKVFPKDAAVQPCLVIVYFGGNDSAPYGLGPHVPLPEYTENMKKIATHLKGLSEETRVILLSCPPVNEEQIGDEMKLTNKTREMYSEALIEMCRELGVKVVDLWNAIQKPSDWLTTCFTDGTHFSSVASNIVVEEILKILREPDWKPHLHWSSLPAEFPVDSPHDYVGLDGNTINSSDSNSHWENKWN